MLRRLFSPDTTEVLGPVVKPSLRFEPDEQFLPYTFTADNPSNTTITSPAGKPLYTSVTTFGKNTITSYTRVPTNEAIGSLEWHDVMSDKIQIGKDAKKVRYSSFMKTSGWVTSLSVFNHNGTKYIWKSDGQLQIELYQATSPDAIAVFQREKKAHQKDPAPAVLLVRSGYTNLLDVIVVSLLALEKNRRMADTSRQNLIYSENRSAGRP